MFWQSGPLGTQRVDCRPNWNTTNYTNGHVCRSRILRMWESNPPWKKSYRLNLRRELAIEVYHFWITLNFWSYYCERSKADQSVHKQREMVYVYMISLVWVLRSWFCHCFFDCYPSVQSACSLLRCHESLSQGPTCQDARQGATVLGADWRSWGQGRSIPTFWAAQTR